MQQYYTAARNNVEAHLGDVLTADMLDPESDTGMDEFYEEVYTLAFDGAKNAGATMEQSRAFATIVRGEY